jgi:hypothetical protein
MPKVNIKVLINILRQHVCRLHEMYVDEKDFGISERLMSEIIKIESVLAELQQIV